MSVRQLAGYARRAVQPKTANYAVTKADVASLILATGSNSWTLALPAAASAGAGFIVTLKNAGTGRITIDPNGSETVNGVLTIGCYQQDTVDLISDGTAWQALFQSPFSIVQAATTTGALATIDLTLPSEFKQFKLDLDGFEPSTSAALGLRLSNDGGATFYSNSGAYAWTGSYDSSSTTSRTTYKSSTGSIFGTTGVDITPGLQGIASGASSSFKVDITTRSTGRFGSIRWEATNGAVTYSGSGFLGVSTSDVSAIRLIYSGSTNIVAGAKYTLIGQRG